MYLTLTRAVSTSGLNWTGEIHQNEKGTSNQRHFGFGPMHRRFRHIKGITWLAWKREGENMKKKLFARYI